MFEWVKGSVFNMVTTLYPTNITLNSSAAAAFKDIRWVMLGLDKMEQKLAIKPIGKSEIDSKIVPLEHLHKISIGKGYARISNKTIINEISVMLGKDIDGNKFVSEYDEANSILIIDLKNEI